MQAWDGRPQGCTGGLLKGAVLRQPGDDMVCVMPTPPGALARLSLLTFWPLIDLLVFAPPGV